MNLTKQDKRNKIISIILLILWLSLIFFFSNQNGELSSNSSSFVVNLVNEFLQLFNPKIDISIYPVTVFIIRKLAHMFLYFILYLLTYYLMYQFNIKKRFILSLLFCIFYAATDEVHQLFINERSGQITDVLVDTLGSIIAIIFLKLVNFLKRKLRKTWIFS